MRILVVEDDECIAKTLENILGNQHYVVDIATDGEIAWELLKAFTYDLILLDIILPKLDGIQLCQRIRSHNYETPVLLLTKQNSCTNKVMGLDAGADDYLAKPFEFPELLARIRVLLRRGKSPLQAVLEWEKIRLNLDSCEVTYNSKILNLTPKEYRLLELFLRNPQKVYSRSEILDHLWSSCDAPKEDTVTAHIKGLRQKLKQAGALGNVIETVYGLGYRLRMPTDTDKLSQPVLETKKLCAVGVKSKLEKNNPATGNSGLSTQHLKQTRAALTQLWELWKGTNCDRVAILEQVTVAGQENRLNEALREKAQHAAHKLAGALGVFGFVKGSRLAAEIEEILQTQQKLHPQQVLHLSDLVVALKQEIQKPAFAELDKVLCDLVVDDASE